MLASIFLLISNLSCIYVLAILPHVITHVSNYCFFDGLPNTQFTDFCLIMLFGLLLRSKTLNIHILAGSDISEKIQKRLRVVRQQESLKS